MLRAANRDLPSPEEALSRLTEGNRRFREGVGVSSPRPQSSGSHAAEVQRPFAIVLGCSDSRTPTEILFDQGFGDLFVVRVAGNAIAPSVVGSIEFAASQFGSPLIVVMGHSWCGAIKATLEAMETGLGPESANIRSITDLIAPHLQGVDRSKNPEAVLREAVRANVHDSVEYLSTRSSILEALIREGRLAVVGAEYDLESGAVHFFEGIPLRGSSTPG